MLQQPEHKIQQTSQQGLADLDVQEQGTYNLSDEELESISGGISKEAKHTWIGAGIGAVLGCSLGPIGSAVGATIGGFIGHKIK